MTKLEELTAAQEKIGCELVRGDVGPCSEQKHTGKSCIQAEEERPLTKKEKDDDWHCRPFWAYDHSKMCNGCRAYWFATMAANVLREMCFWEARLKAEEEKKSQQSGD